ncbi:MAG: serine/threonine protein kinase [Planctomycetota bacterium]|nr:serine/threonine protein kinase [Planctomycetota bacterium]
MPFSNPEYGDKYMDGSRYEINPELEEALFKYEEQRVLQKDISLEFFLQSYPTLKDQLQKAIQKLQKMDWLLTTDSEPTGENFPDKETVIPSNITKGDSPVSGYRLIKKIGRGSFGEVWEAKGPGDVSLAMKIIPMANGLDIVEIRSLNLFKSIRHPHLLSIFGFWIIEEYLWIAFELAEMNFLEYVNKNKPSENEILSMFTDAAEALNFLNQKRHLLEDGETVSILHRDIKPQNMLIVGGALKLGDFGLARILDEETNQHSGCMTPSYSPPEFFQEKMSATSDQYSLAITYCQIQGGALPFIGNASEIMAGHCNRQPDLSMIPIHQRWVVARALDKNPLKRWESCSEFISQIKLAISTPAKTPSRLNRRSIFLGALVGVALIALGLFSMAVMSKPNKTVFDEITLVGHQGEVYCAALSEDEKIAISGSKDKQVIVWDLENQKAKFIFNDHTEDIISVAISKDGKQALSGGHYLDNRVILWDLVKGIKIKELAGHQHRISNVCFLPDGKRAISCSWDCTARLWDLESGTQIQFFELLDTYDPKNIQFGSPRQVWRIDLSEDGKTMVCCLRDGKICVYDVASGKRIQTMNGPEQIYKSLSINKEATIAITAFGGAMQTLREPIDLKIIRWDLITSKREVLMETEGAVDALFAPKSTSELFVFPKKGSPFLYDLKTKLKTNILGHLDSEVNCSTGNDKGTTLLLGCKDFSVRLLKRN